MKFIKTNITVLKNPWIGFGDFIRTHYLLAIEIAVFLLLIYGGQAFSNYFYIDKEVFINNPGTLYNWGETGRFGLILVNKLFGMSWYNPYLGGVLFLLFLWLAAMAGGYLFCLCEARLKTTFLFVFMLLFWIYPTYVELFSFQFLAFEAVLAVVFLLISDWYLILALQGKNGFAFLVSIPLVVISFGIYQSMVPLQLCLYLSIFLMLVYEKKGEKETIFSVIKYTVLHFAASMGIYELIAQLFFSGSNYLDSQIVWMSGDLEKAFYNIAVYIYHIVWAKGAFFTLVFDLCWLLGLIALLILFVRYRFKAVWYGLGLLGVVLSPFLLSFVMGSHPAARTQMTLPLANGVLWLFGIHVITQEIHLKWKKTIAGLLVILGGIMVYLNVMPMMRMFYTRDVIGKADEMTAAMIVRELDRIPAAYEGTKPVIFIGYKEAQTNEACYTLEDCWTYPLMSAFEFDYSFQPYYLHSTNRILGFFKTLGIQNFKAPAEAQMPSAYVDSAAMPVWPTEGSIQEFDQYVIVKLGEAELLQ